MRADFIRFLALGGDDATPIHEKGVRLQGAWVQGELSLSASNVMTLVLLHCRIERLEATDASARLLILSGSLVVEGILANRLQAASILLRQGFKSTGDVRLLGAIIGGQVNFEGATLIKGENEALNCDGAVIKGDLVLARGFHADGEVRLLGAHISGDLECSGGVFENEIGDALSCDRAVITGGVFLDDGFAAKGTVRFPTTEVGGSITCSGGNFHKENGECLVLDGATIKRSVFLNHNCTTVGAVRLVGTAIGRDLDCAGGSFQVGAADALSCDGTQVEGVFFFRGVKKFSGGMSLSSMSVTSLCDDYASWIGTRQQLALDGFTYKRLGGGAPTGWAMRVEWLNSQRKQFLLNDFRPQPWEQLSAVLKSMGHPDDARQVAIAKHVRMRNSGRFVAGSRVWDWLYGSLVGYGYHPWRLLRTMLTVWLACAFVYWIAANPTQFGLTQHYLAPVRADLDPICLMNQVKGACPPRKPRYEEL
ncbi:MAG TPA: hypothetical protein VGB65_07135, partial [Allosphingosinicella sp.]